MRCIVVRCVVRNFCLRTSLLKCDYRKQMFQEICTFVTHVVLTVALIYAIRRYNNTKPKDDSGCISKVIFCRGKGENVDETCLGPALSHQEIIK